MSVKKPLNWTSRETLSVTKTTEVYRLPENGNNETDGTDQHNVSDKNNQDDSRNTSLADKDTSKVTTGSTFGNVGGKASLTITGKGRMHQHVGDQIITNNHIGQAKSAASPQNSEGEELNIIIYKDTLGAGDAMKQQHNQARPKRASAVDVPSSLQSSQKKKKKRSDLTSTKKSSSQLSELKNFKVYERYAKMGKLKEKRTRSQAPQDIMGSVEILVYKNRNKEASECFAKLREKLDSQSHPSANDFQILSESCQTKGKNPVRVTLFHFASAQKEEKENPDRLDMTKNVLCSIEKISRVVYELTASKSEALKHLVSGGAHAPSVAEFLVTIMEDMYRHICKTSPSGSLIELKLKTLSTLATCFYKVNQLDKVIALTNGKKFHWDAIKNEDTVRLIMIRGMSFKEKGKQQKALLALEEAKSLAKRLEAKQLLDEIDHEIKDITKKPPILNIK